MTLSMVFSKATCNAKVHLFTMDPIVIMAVSFLAVFVLLVTVPLCKESPGFQSSSGAFLGLWRVRRFWKVNEIAKSW